MWIDCICINQIDRAEKAVQIPLMADIYGQAERVVCWLGKAADGSERVMESIRNNDVDDFKTVEFHNAILHVLMRPWFRRTWVLQEFAISASEPLIACGRRAPICWSCLYAAYEATTDEDSRVREIMRRTMRDDVDLIPDISTWPSKILVGLKRLCVLSLIQPTQPGHIALNSLNALRRISRRGFPRLGMALNITTRSQCTEPRDKIYGLLGLLQKDLRESFIKQYGVSYERGQETDVQALRDAAAWIIANEDNEIFVLYDTLQPNGNAN